MARLATLALLLLSLLAVASCRDLEAISDDQGPPIPVLLTRDDLADAAAEVATLPSFPAPAVAGDEDEVALRLPSHRGHLWLVRHHDLFHRRGAFSCLGEARVQRAAFFPTEPDRGEEQAPWEAVLEAVAESDPDGEQKPFLAEEEGEGNEAVKEWKVEMASMFGHGVGLHHRHHHDQEEEDEHGQDKDEDMNTKLLGRYHLHAHDGDHEADELEELPRRLGPATTSTRRSFNHGYHHHGAEEGGVKNWFKGLMNRF